MRYNRQKQQQQQQRSDGSETLHLPAFVIIVVGFTTFRRTARTGVCQKTTISRYSGWTGKENMARPLRIEVPAVRPKNQLIALRPPVY
jgi:hypothetical protein